ncbi:MAG: hypothetical protein IPK64_22200 [bacterium]|nr:hypothetical protein [bacterium]
MARETGVERSRRWAARAGALAGAAAAGAGVWGAARADGLALAWACWLAGGALAAWAWRRAARWLPPDPPDAAAVMAGAFAAMAGLAGAANGYWLLFAAGAPLGLSAARAALLAEQFWLGPVALAWAGICWGLFRWSLRREEGPGG